MHSSFEAAEGDPVASEQTRRPWRSQTHGLGDQRLTTEPLLGSSNVGRWSCGPEASLLAAVEAGLMRWLVSFIIRFGGLVVTQAVGLIVPGVTQLPRTPVDILPEFMPTVVGVQTETLGFSAEVYSVIITFEPGSDQLRARQMVAERLTQAVGVAGLPKVAKAPHMLVLSSTSRVVMVKPSSNEVSPIEMPVGSLGTSGRASWGDRTRTWLLGECRRQQLIVDRSSSLGSR